MTQNAAEPAPYGSRADHLEWAKRRAVAYLPDWQTACTSFLSDLSKHPELELHAVQELMGMSMLSGFMNAREARDLIEGTR